MKTKQTVETFAFRIRARMFCSFRDKLEIFIVIVDASGQSDPSFQALDHRDVVHGKPAPVNLEAYALERTICIS